MLNAIANHRMNHCGVPILQLIECFLGVWLYWPHCFHLLSVTCLSLSPRFHWVDEPSGSTVGPSACSDVVFSCRLIIFRVFYFPRKTWYASQSRQNRLGCFLHHAHVRLAHLLALVHAKCCCYCATIITNFPVCIWQISVCLVSKQSTGHVLGSPVVCNAALLRFVSAAANLASRLSSNFCLAVILVLVVMEMTFQMTCSHSVCAPEWSWYCSFSQTNGPKLESSVNRKPLLYETTADILMRLEAVTR